MLLAPFIGFKAVPQKRSAETPEEVPAIKWRKSVLQPEAPCKVPETDPLVFVWSPDRKKDDISVWMQAEMHNFSAFCLNRKKIKLLDCRLHHLLKLIK